MYSFQSFSNIKCDLRTYELPAVLLHHISTHQCINCRRTVFVLRHVCVYRLACLGGQTVGMMSSSLLFRKFNTGIIDYRINL
jgi:hypothetical protein